VRILHVIEGLHPDRGGPPEVVMSLASAQRDAGHELSIASHDADTPEVDVVIRDRGLAGVGRIRIDACAAWGDRSFAAALVGCERPDAMHLHGVWNPIVPQAARWACRNGIPFAVSTHGSLHPFPMSRSRWKKRLALASTHRILLRRSACVFVLNDEERDAAAALGAGRVELLPNGVRVEANRTADTSSWPQRSRPYLVYLGRLDWTKGVERLVEAHRAVLDQGVDCDLVLVGNDWGSRASIEAAIAAAGTVRRVEFTGPKYGAEKRSVLRHAALLVHLPRYEGFGMAVLEGLAVGTPAVIGDRCLLPGAGPEIGTVVTRSEPEAFAVEVIRLLRRPDERSVLSDAGYRAVRERFAWPMIAARCVDVLSTSRAVDRRPPTHLPM